MKSETDKIIENGFKSLENSIKKLNISLNEGIMINTMPIKNEINNLNRALNEGFRSINVFPAIDGLKNLESSIKDSITLQHDNYMADKLMNDAKSFDVSSIMKLNGVENDNSNGWKLAIPEYFGTGYEFKLPEEKRYVYVKIQSCKKKDIFPYPHIATLEGYNWYTQDGHIMYGSEEWPYEVILWKYIYESDIYDNLEENNERQKNE